jgi:hypothetical protein
MAQTFRENDVLEAWEAWRWEGFSLAGITTFNFRDGCFDDAEDQLK